jgi:CubicO group peptidase (beta-lactamase class C family)
MNVYKPLEVTIGRLCKRTGVTGIAVAVIRNGQLTFSHATGTLDLNVPIPVASLSKPVFAYAVLKLID